MSPMDTDIRRRARHLHSKGFHETLALDVAEEEPANEWLHTLRGKHVAAGAWRTHQAIDRRRREEARSRHEARAWRPASLTDPPCPLEEEEQAAAARSVLAAELDAMSETRLFALAERFLDDSDRAALDVSSHGAPRTVRWHVAAAVAALRGALGRAHVSMIEVPPPRALQLLRQSLWLAITRKRSRIP